MNNDCWIHHCNREAEAKGMFFSEPGHLIEFLQATNAQYCEQHAQQFIRSGHFVIIELL